MVVMVFAAAMVVIVVVLVIVLMVVIVIMMVFMFVIVIMLVIMFVMMIMMVFMIMVMVLRLVFSRLGLVFRTHFGQQFFRQGYLFNCGENYLAVQLIPGGGEDGGLRVFSWSMATAASSFSWLSFWVRERTMVPALSIWLL